MRTLHVHKLGRVEYDDGLRLMALAGDAVRAAAPPATDHLFLLEHPPVLTLGRSAGRANILAAPEWLRKQGFEIHETDRGGDVTYHGPGQIVGYPVLDLSQRPDVRKYVATLEEAMIRTCDAYGIAAGRHEEHRGAWVGHKKIGAVGVHLARWVTSHGFAFNVAPDLRHFQVIVPCGIADPRLGVTSLAEELRARGRALPPTGEVLERLAAAVVELFGRARVDRAPDLRTVSVVPVGADGRVLLLRRSEARGGFWQPVTGRLEPGEAPEAGARRELCEETGADVLVSALAYTHAFALDPRLVEGGAAAGVRIAEETAFAARLPPGFECRLSDEHAEHAWLAPAEAQERLPYAGLRKAVQLATG
ncbi:MAG: lipoyl(octanoyl) transferase LipB [Anaeromyxobacteraceae bacterium]